MSVPVYFLLRKCAFFDTGKDFLKFFALVELSRQRAIAYFFGFLIGALPLIASPPQKTCVQVTKVTDNQLLLF